MRPTHLLPNCDPSKLHHIPSDFAGPLLPPDGNRQVSIASSSIWCEIHPDKTPFQIPPSGVDLNDNLGPLAIRSVMACSVLAGLAVLGRFLSRRLMKADLWATDLLIAIGLIGAWALSGLVVWGKMLARSYSPASSCTDPCPDARMGLGRHIWVVPPQNLTQYSKFSLRAWSLVFRPLTVS